MDRAIVRYNHTFEAIRDCLNKTECVQIKLYSLGNILKAITSCKIHQNDFKYGFTFMTLQHYLSINMVPILICFVLQMSVQKTKQLRYQLVGTMFIERYGFCCILLLFSMQPHCCPQGQTTKKWGQTMKKLQTWTTE